MGGVRREIWHGLAGLLFVIALCGATAGQYISSDTYTRYELLAPESHQFKIYYEVTETRAGARFHFNAIREGSEASDESVIDLATGKLLKFEVVTGAQAKTDSPSENFSPTGRFIKVHLAHPVRERGEYRLAIIKTYKDDKSYYTEGDQIVFKRLLSIPRNSVVLPAGYEIVSCSVATQVLMESDGRLKLAFVNAGSGGSLEVTIKARKLPPAKNPERARVPGRFDYLVYSYLAPASELCRSNRISPCKLRDLGVSVLKISKKTIHHGDTEHAEKIFPTDS
jgi:hypothetical protein